MSRFVPGQRWISTAEPELGLGTVLRVEGRAVQVLFATSGVLRQYAQQSAPLLRAAFRAGQQVQSHGRSVCIEQVEERDGLLIYRIGDDQIAEGELDDEQSVSQADERLLAGRVDPVDHFELRLATLERLARNRQSAAYGLQAARIAQFPHQARVADAACAMRAPRVLLADEVGLGKTIEAGMIIARQIASGRAQRVLILLPESLIHQWFVELLRRFNLAFAIFDESRARAISGDDAGRNPFEDDQLVIAGIDFLAGSPQRAAQALEAGWDLLLVDEAHHLEWTEQTASPEYQLVEQFAHSVPAVVLITATPEQLGRSGHFARLRLLDPARYHELASFLAESEQYRGLSDIAGRLHAGDALSAKQCEQVCLQFPEDEALREQVLAHTRSRVDSDALLDALIDRHGTGRVMFRSRREHVGGFPGRSFHLALLDEADAGWRDRLLAEFESDTLVAPLAAEFDYAGDPRIAWLLGLLESHSGDKFLLICRSAEKVQAIEAALQPAGVRFARFHEGLGIVQRDRNAAWFAEPDGARLLLSSEIGSEGRNFQFARHLVLWDLPLDPDLLEQRIGRLDRIGQRHDVELHLAVAKGSAQHLLARWFDQGLEAFRSSPADGRELLRRFGSEVVRLAIEHARSNDDMDQEFDALLDETRSVHADLSTRIHQGRDRLLELANLRSGQGTELLDAVGAADSDQASHAYIERLFESFGIGVDDLGGEVLRLDPEYLGTDSYAGFSQGPVAATFERKVAMERDELALLRLDHPLVAQGMEILLGSEYGNASFLADTALPPRTAVLQAVFVLECVADKALDAGRFLPPTPLVVAVDSRQQTVADFQPSAAALARALEQPLDAARLRKLLLRLLPPMLASAERHAAARGREVSELALAQARGVLGAERTRLQALARVNPSVDPEDAEWIAQEFGKLEKALAGARVRLDALRFVVSPDVLGLR